jgi:hypothetical protein
MDARRFDALSRALVARATRRGTLVSLLGGTLGLLGVAETAGKKGKGKKGKGKGKKPKTCKPGECDKCKFQTCVKGHCGCAPGTREQGGVCGADPQCLSVLQICTTNDECCSGACNLADGAELRCNFSSTNCHIDFDCRIGPCRGFLCPETYHAFSGC